MKIGALRRSLLAQTPVDGVRKGLVMILAQTLQFAAK